MPETLSIDPIREPEWLDFVAGNPSAPVFHHPAWLELLSAQYGYRVRAWCACDGRGIRAGMPVAEVRSRLTGSRLVALPFSDVCAPATAPGAGAAPAAAVGRALHERALETGLPLTVHGPLPGAPASAARPRFVLHNLRLRPDREALERGYSKSNQRCIRRARREGLRVERREDAAALDSFYRLHLGTRRRLGVPTQPRRFIARFRRLFEGGLGFVALVRDGDEPVAAAVFLTCNGTLTYKYGASAARALAKRPNNLLFAETIGWACEAGFERLDLGRTELANEGLRSFKRSWGAAETELSYTYLNRDEPRPADGTSLRERVVGTTIRRSPPLVGRLAGAALYRHVA